MGDTKDHNLIWLWLMRDAILRAPEPASGILCALSFRRPTGNISPGRLTPLVDFPLTCRQRKERQSGEDSLTGSIQFFGFLLDSRSPLASRINHNQIRL